MAGSKRERDLHRAKIARQQKEAAEAAERRKRRLTIGAAVGGVLVVIVAIAGVAIASSGDDSDTGSTATPTTSAPAQPLATPAVAPSSPADIAKVKCKPVNDKKPANTQYAESDVTGQVRPNSKYTEAVTTNCGAMEFTLASEAAPNTVKHFTFLSDRGFFDNTLCHRLDTSISIIQCGDPLANGTGGPGFRIAEENTSPDGKLARGTVAMAKTSEPSSTGSQFFIVYADTQLPPEYTILGTVTKGMQIADYVASKGVKGGGTNGPPNQPLQITKMISTLSYSAAPGQ